MSTFAPAKVFPPWRVPPTPPVAIAGRRPHKYLNFGAGHRPRPPLSTVAPEGPPLVPLGAGPDPALPLTPLAQVLRPRPSLDRRSPDTPLEPGAKKPSDHGREPLVRTGRKSSNLGREPDLCCKRSVNQSSFLAPADLSPASRSILARFFSALYRTSSSGPLRWA